jgi:hypothetical protein
MRFAATWLAASVVLSAVAGLFDLFHRIDLVVVIVATVAIVFCVMLAVQFPSEPVITGEREQVPSDAESWSRAVIRLVFLREMIQRTLTYPTKTDRALQDLLADLVRFRGSGRRGTSPAIRGSDHSTELSYETRAFLDGTAPATVRSLRVVIGELESL